MYKAVLFDWNGVIMDDVEAVARANCDVIFELCGNKVSHNIWLKEITQDWHAFFARKGVKKEDLPKALPLMKKYYPKYEKYIKLSPGIEKVLQYLHDHDYKVGILSGVDRYSILENLKKFNLEPYFDFVISGEDIKHPKPHPEGLKKAIRLFGVKPSEILYVDDMPTIFMEAKKLKLKTIGFPSRISGDLSDADIDIRKANDILKIIYKI